MKARLISAPDVGVLVTGLVVVRQPAAEPAAAVAAAHGVPDGAVERTRREMRLPDDIYKVSIVLITTHCVNDDEDLAAGSASHALFAAVADKRLA